MVKPALPDDVLMSIEKPARYIGNEINMVRKDPASVDIRFCMCFPDVYEIGMSHLGIQILYDMFNRRDDVYCERVYSPWVDLDKVMRERNIKLFSLETQTDIKKFDFLGITIQYEMCYTNILQVLDLSGIPIFAKDRTDEDPIVIGGGPCVYNPEPLADFFDLFYIGEGETQYDRLLDIYKEVKEKYSGATVCGDGENYGKAATDKDDNNEIIKVDGYDHKVADHSFKKRDAIRKEFLERAAHVEGIYVPSFYETDYNEDGTIKEFKIINPNAEPVILKQVVTDLSNTFYPEKPLVPLIRATQDRVVLEIQRGCIRGCRFCQAGMLYRPIRERNVDYLKDMAVKMLKATGHEEISLSSLSSSDYSELKELVYFLIDEISGNGVNISLPSLRIDAFSLDVMSKVQDIRKSSLTFAPEAGSQRLRNVINKGLTEEVILKGAMEAFNGGWNKVKLYFMLGLPTETEDDIEGIAILSDRIAREYYTIPKDQRNGKVSIVTSTSFFVPKPFTPFQWTAMASRDDFLNKQRFLNGKMREQLNQKSIKYNWHEAETTMIEGVLARGDRRLCKALYDIYKKGCIYDAWSEYFKYDIWMETFKEDGIDPDFYTVRERAQDEILPWDFIDIGVTKKFLWREYMRAKNEEVTPNCRAKCAGCGTRRFNTGVCVESDE